MSFLEQLKTVAAEAEVTLDRITNKNYGSERLQEAIRYSALNGGKRLRAYMVAEFCELCGVDRKTVADYGAAVEMIHAFSLIHDDLPAMDNDDMRRGKPSNHKAFGEATAILAGDALALDAFAAAGKNKYCSNAQNAEAMILLSEKAGSLGMCNGQQIDIDGEGKSIELSELIMLVDNKTGALFECACALGCIGANANETQKKVAKRFGLLAGRAFQITDDLLDIHSTAEELGKTVGKDVSAGKSTFPALMGEEGAREEAKNCIAEAKECLTFFADCDAKNRLYEFCDYMLSRKH